MNQPDLDRLFKQNTRHLFFLITVVLAVGLVLFFGWRSNRAHIDDLEQRVRQVQRP